MALREKIASLLSIASDLARQERSGNRVQDISASVHMAHALAEALQEIDERLEKLEEAQGK